MTWKCSGCGTENPDDAIYCTTCGLKKPEGTKIPQEAEATPQVPTEQPATAQSPEQQVQAPPEPSPVQQTTPAVEQPTPQAPQPQVTQVQQPQPTQEAPQVQATGKYYIQFIATPVSSLNKTKVPLDFEVFETISLGRSPENVLMIPDNEISRRHALLYREGDNIYIEDLNSTNGTYVYDGKVFQAVKGKILLPKNAVVKLGNSTIIKIVRE